MTHAVFFDIGNTLLYPYPSVTEVCREILIEAGHHRDAAEIDRLMPLVDEYYEDRFREDDTFWTDEGETSQVWVGMYSLLCRELGIDEDAEALARRVYDEFGRPERWRAYDDVRPALTRLKKQHDLKLGVISNWDGRLEALLSGLGLAEMFDTIISDPSDAVHVGDHHYSDIVGATAVGMTAVLIDRFGPADETKAISSLDQLEPFLGWED
jgi:putative hydrolase of the HAD superfamily